MLETSASISRQYIDAVSVFEALEEALEEAAHVRGQCCSVRHPNPSDLSVSKLCLRDKLL